MRVINDGGTDLNGPLVAVLWHCENDTTGRLPPAVISSLGVEQQDVQSDGHSNASTRGSITFTRIGGFLRGFP
jgi:hypothetical protein